MNGFQHVRDVPYLGGRHMAEYIAIEVNHGAVEKG